MTNLLGINSHTGGFELTFRFIRCELRIRLLNIFFCPTGLANSVRDYISILPLFISEEFDL